MNEDISKSIIRIVHDYCFANSASVLVDKFALSITPKIIVYLNNKNFNTETLRNAAKSRRDFFIANDLNIREFCKGLFLTIKQELAYCKSEVFFDSLIRFKHKIEDGIFKSLVESDDSEDKLRRLLAMFISEETFLEPEMSGGKCDICIPKEKTIIETKLWKGEVYYQAGFPELDSYLSGRMYNEGYYVIFDYTKNGCDHFNKNNGVFDVIFNDKIIHVIFIRMNPIAPSKKSKL